MEIRRVTSSIPCLVLAAAMRVEKPVPSFLFAIMNMTAAISVCPMSSSQGLRARGLEYIG
eukprot:633779-Pelagomonas_calceolata.AAC.1